MYKFKCHVPFYKRNSNLKYFDCSNWDVSNVIAFSQMFEGMPYLTEIKGLETWNTSNAICFAQMFSGCPKLEKLDLSGFDTRKAKADGTYTSQNGSKASCTESMLAGLKSIKEIKLGENFTMSGNGTASANKIGVLPTPASGYWYNAETGQAYATNEIPNLTAATYVSTQP